MKYASLIWAGLWRKPLRTVFTMLSLMMAFVLFGVLQSVTAGLDHLIATTREDRLMVFPRFNNPPFPIAFKNQIESLPDLAMVNYQAFFRGYVGDPKNSFFLDATNDDFLATHPEIGLTPAQRTALRSTPDGIVVSEAFAKRLGLKVGDRVPVISNIRKIDGGNDWSFQVVAVTDRDDNPGVYQFSIGNYKFVNEQRASDKDIVTMFDVVVSDPDKTIDTAKAIDVMFENSATPARSLVERLAATASVRTLGDVNFFVTSVVGCVMAVLLLLTATTMIQSVNERITEFGVLKTLGYSDRQVLGFIFAESFLQCLVGAVTGLTLAWAMSPLIQGKIPGPPVVFHVPWSVFAAGVLLAVGVAILSAVLPAIRVTRLQIVEALVGK